MFMKEVREKSGLTRKAIEYYEENGLITPQKQENGYRCYSLADVERLKRIALYRQLGLSLEEITAVLEKKVAMSSLARDKELCVKRDSLRQALLERLAREGMNPDIMAQAAALTREENVAVRLARVLPGYLGQVLINAYAPYLREPCTTPDQEAAFMELIDYLDELPPFTLSEELKGSLEENAVGISLEMLDKVQQEKEKALDDVEGWLNDNEQMLRFYRTYKNSLEYQALPFVKIKSLARDYFIKTGFYDKVIPLLRRLSPAYDRYHRQLLSANEVLLTRMPELRHENKGASEERS